MRIAYLDEAGISNPIQEPYLVVAAVIVHPDIDAGPITKELRALTKEYDLPWITHFHAKDIWHGTGLFDRNDPKWPLNRRLELLARLAALPAKFSLPVAIGYVHRPTYKITSDTFYQKLERELGTSLKRPKALHLAQHAEAFVKAAKAVDTWMQKNAPAECAILIAEDVPQIKRDLKIIHAISQSKHIDIKLFTTESFKTEQIIETLHFAEKRESPFLQLADICAFVAKRRLMKKPDTDTLYKLIEPQLIRLPRNREPFRFSLYYEDDE